MSQAQIDNLIDQFTQAREQANEANRQRYQQLLDTIGQLEQNTQGLYGQAYDTVAGLGDVERRRIQEEQQRQLAATEQDLISRGLGNTTIRQTARRGVQSDALQAQQDLMERLAQQRVGLLQNQAGALMQTGQMEANAIRSRTDQAPATGRYAQMIQQLAAQPDQGRDETFVGRGVPNTPIGGAGGPAPGSARTAGTGGGGGGTGGSLDYLFNQGGSGGGQTPTDIVGPGAGQSFGVDRTTTSSISGLGTYGDTAKTAKRKSDKKRSAMVEAGGLFPGFNKA